MTPEVEAMAGAEAVLITHKHFDRFGPERLRAAAEPCGLGLPKTD